MIRFLGLLAGYDEFKTEIRKAIHYSLPIHLMPAYADSRYRAGDFPVAEACARSVLSLPLHPRLTTGQVEQVAAQVCELAPQKVHETLHSSR
jgi:dTDP-4-amino-4,6-dideoxygalactose transaminase